MGACNSLCVSSENQQDAAVHKQLAVARQKEAVTLKLLFLGTGDSGKTTVFKQMRLLYGEGYDEESRRPWAQAIIANLIVGTKDVIEACASLPNGSKLKHSAAKKAAAQILEVTNNQELTASIAKSISTLWDDEDFQKTWSHRAEFQVLEAYGDFAAQVHKYPKWGGPDWVPTIQDTIRARIRTSGIVESVFTIDKVRFKMVDVGGQRNERRKWIHCFDNVTAVIFLVAISEYDQKLFEDKHQNRMVEAMELYKQMANSPWFKNSFMIVFFNKIDLFKEKYCKQHIPLNAGGVFPDAPNDPTFNYDKATKFIENKFVKQSKRSPYVHFTCALDTDFIGTVFASCKDAILKSSLVGAGFMDPSRSGF